jgi:ligand-binding sensor domain-containing protein
VFSPENDLVQSQVEVLFQDSKNQMWVGTLGGLTLLVGNSNYAFTTANGLSDGAVRTIYEDSNNRMWFGLDGGLSYLEKDNWGTFKQISNAHQFKIKSIIEYKKRLLITTAYNGMFQIIADTLQRLPRFEDLKKETLHAFEVYKDTLWIASSHHLYSFSVTLENRRDGNFLALASKDSTLWISTINGILSYSQSGFKSISSGNISLQLSARDNQLLAADYNGLPFILKNNDLFVFDRSSGLPKYSYKAAIIDNEGSYWLGSDGHGLFQILPHSFRNYTTISGLESPIINHISSLPNGTILVSTDSGLFMSKDSKYFSKVPLPKNILIWSSHYWSENHLIVGSDEETWIIEYSNNWTMNHWEKVFDFPVFDLARVQDTIWVATENYPRYFADGYWHLPKGTEKIRSQVCKCIATKDSHVWIGTSNGLISGDYGQLTPYYFGNQTQNNIWDLLIDGSYNVHLATNGGYIVKDASSGGLLKKTDISDGLPSNIIFSIGQTSKKNIILGTANGLVIQDINGVMLNYTTKDGLPSNEFNGGALQNLGNNIWIGSMGGLTHFKIDAITKTKFETSLIFYYFENNESVASFKNNYRTNHPNLRIQVESTSLINHNNQIQYRLLSETKTKWKAINKDNSVELSALAPGDYTLNFRLKNNAGFEESIETLSFTILVPLWQRSWFYALLAIISFVIAAKVSSVLVIIKTERALAARHAEEIEMTRIFSASLDQNVDIKIPGLDVEIKSIGQHEYSGDFSGILKRNDHLFVFVVGDVSGHGLETSYLNTFLKFDIQMLENESYPPETWLKDLNAKLYRQKNTGLNVALSLMRLDIDTFTYKIMSAGMPAPVIINQDLLHSIALEPQPPIGVFNEMQFEWESGILDEKSIICMYSDGLTIQSEPRGMVSAKPIMLLEKLQGLGYFLPGEDDWTFMTIAREKELH